MADAIRSALERIQQSSAALNKVTDLASQTVKEVEKFLDSCSLGITASVQFREDDDDGTIYRLGYRKVGRNFRIVVFWGRCHEDEYLRAWSECSRDEKLETFEKLPELLNTIADSVDNQIALARDVVISVSAAIPVLSKKEAGN